MGFFFTSILLLQLFLRYCFYTSEWLRNASLSSLLAKPFRMKRILKYFFLEEYRNAVILYLLKLFMTVKAPYLLGSCYN